MFLFEFFDCHINYIINPSDKSEQALQGIKEMKNPYATIINASDKSEQALRAIKIQ